MYYMHPIVSLAWNVNYLIKCFNGVSTKEKDHINMFRKMSVMQILQKDYTYPFCWLIHPSPKLPLCVMVNS